MSSRILGGQRFCTTSPPASLRPNTAQEQLIVRQFIPVLGAAVMVIVVSMFLLGGPAIPPARESPEASPASAGESTPPAPPQAVTSATFVGPGHADVLHPAPTAHKQQSKLWFNDGSWWAALLDAGGAFRIHRLDWASQAWIGTGTLLDNRRFARLDVLWDGGHLYVAGAGSRTSASHAARMARYSYDPEAERYALDADFPVQLTSAGVDDLMIARDSVGVLWVSYLQDGALWVNRTMSDDHHWGTPYVPPVDGTSSSIAEAAIVAYGERIGVVWSNTAEDSVYFASRADDRPDDVWSSSTIAVRGLKNADDHLHVKATKGRDGWRVFVAVKTALDTVEHPNPLDPQVLLLVLEPDATWATHLVGRVTDEHTRPIMLIDEEHGLMYVVAAAPFGGGSVYYKSTPLDDIAFSPGVGKPLVVHPDHARIGDATATKQTVGSLSGLVVLAYDTSTRHYIHGVLPIGDGVPPPSASALAEPPPAELPPPSLLVNDAFDALPLEPLPQLTWTASGGGSGPNVSEAASGGNVAVATTSPSGDRVRFCRLIAPVTGPLIVSVDMTIDALGESAVTVGSIRSSREAPASVRITRRGTLAYSDSGEQVETEVTVTTGRWYRSVLHLDPGGAYAWTFSDRDLDTVLLERGGIRWTPEPGGADRFCMQTPNGLPDAKMQIDNLRIEG